jgi:transcriptional regulator with XRE-family HTH domain
VQSPFRPQIMFAMLDNAGLRQADIARAIGVSEPTVCNWVKGNHSMSPAHYAALVKLAASYESVWLSIHRAMTRQPSVEEPIPGYRLHVQAFAGDYRAQMHQSFRACLASIIALSTDPPGDWNYQALSDATEELASMSRALRIIMEEQKEKDHA